MPPRSSSGRNGRANKKVADSGGGRARRVWRRLFRLAGYAALIAVIVAVPWVVWLDRQVTEKFSGQKWQLPAQVYARPLEVYPGVTLARELLVAELGRLGYRPIRDPQQAGQYSASRNVVEVHTRPFRFWDGEQPSQRLRISFNGDAVEGLTSDLVDDAIAIARLDPALIGSIYPGHGEDRVLVQLETVPRLLSAGLVAVEDKRFYQHHGFDPRGFARAMAANIKARRMVQGGSTITQQLVKNYFLTSARSVLRKANEAVMALLLERHNSKEEILEAYLNEIYLGQDGPRAVHGFGLGSYYYFRKPLAELAPHELALMVGIIKGPSYYSPRRRPERATQRRGVVLDLWEQQGLLSPEVAAAARAAPLGVVERGSRGTTQYPDFVDLVKRQLRRDYDEADLTDEGLRIFTTLDPLSQAAAEQAVSGVLPRIEQGRDLKPNSLQAAMVMATPDSGEIRALVGGRDSGFAGFNRALEAQRPIGSLIKPFVYLAALQPDTGHHLATPLADRPISLAMPNGSVWEPQNYDGEFREQMPMYEALIKSVNLPTVHLGLRVGVERVVTILNQHGLDREVPPYPSLLLGATSLTPLEVTQLFQPLASGGFVSPLTAIREVTTAEGRPLKRYPLDVSQASSAQTTYLIARTLQLAVSEGTGRSLGQRMPAHQFAGKTGTTNEYRDSWFAGFGGDLVAVTWVGHDDNTSTGLTGASGALQVWTAAVQGARPAPLKLQPPAGILELEVLPDAPMVTDETCPQRVALPFLASSTPDVWAPCARRRGAFDSNRAVRDANKQEGEEEGLLDRLFRIFD